MLEKKNEPLVASARLWKTYFPPHFMVARILRTSTTSAPMCMLQHHQQYIQSLEFVLETRTLAEMKIKNRGTKYFPWEKIDKHTFFSMKIKMMDLWMQIPGRKLIFTMIFSVLDFFKFASRMPQIAQILVSTFKIFPGKRAPAPPRYFLFSFL